MSDCAGCKKPCDKKVTNNKIENPLKHYREIFAEKDPEAMARRSNVAYEDGVFTLSFLTRKVSLKWPELSASYEDGTCVGEYATILLARYVMEGVFAPAGGKMYSFKEMPWGSVYEDAFDGRCIKRLAFSFGTNLENFKKSCAAIGGKEVKGGDAAFDIVFLPELTIRLIIWEGDDEFPPGAQILFSDNFTMAFTAEDMAVVGDVLLNAMKNRW